MDDQLASDELEKHLIINFLFSLLFTIATLWLAIDTGETKYLILTVIFGIVFVQSTRKLYWPDLVVRESQINYGNIKSFKKRVSDGATVLIVILLLLFIIFGAISMVVGMTVLPFIMLDQECSGALECSSQGNTFIVSTILTTVLGLFIYKRKGKQSPTLEQPEQYSGIFANPFVKAIFATVIATVMKGCQASNPLLFESLAFIFMGLMMGVYLVAVVIGVKNLVPWIRTKLRERENPKISSTQPDIAATTPPIHTSSSPARGCGAGLIFGLAAMILTIFWWRSRAD